MRLNQWWGETDQWWGETISGRVRLNQWWGETWEYNDDMKLIYLAFACRHATSPYIYFKIWYKTEESKTAADLSDLVD